MVLRRSFLGTIATPCRWQMPSYGVFFFGISLTDARCEIIVNFNFPFYLWFLSCSSVAVCAPQTTHSRTASARSIFRLVFVGKWNCRDHILGEARCREWRVKSANGHGDGFYRFWSNMHFQFQNTERKRVLAQRCTVAGHFDCVLKLHKSQAMTQHPSVIKSSGHQPQSELHLKFKNIVIFL